MSSRLLLLAAALLLNQGVTRAQDPASSGPFFLQPFNDPKKCLQSQKGDGNGSPVVLADCNGSVDQQFTFSNGLIMMYGDQMCLDVTNGVNNDGTLLQIWECYLKDVNQQWWWTEDNHIAWTDHGKCLDLTNGSLDNGNQVQIWDCSGNDYNQIWYLAYV